MNSIPHTLDLAYAAALGQANNPRQRLSLERIKAACDYLDKNGLKISPATVERYCLDREWNGPKAQSIRNSKGMLMRYLELRQSGQRWNTPVKGTKSMPEIADESIRAYVQLLKEERDQALAERSRIEAGLRKLPGLRVDDIIRGIPPVIAKEVASVAAKPEIPSGSALRDALLVLFDESKLCEVGLEFVKGRLRHSATKNVLLEKGHMEALQALLTRI